MVVKGYKKPLEESDLYELNAVDKAGVWVPNFEKAWRQETNRLLLRWLLVKHSSGGVPQSLTAV